jgi:sulfite oxidase
MRAISTLIRNVPVTKRSNFVARSTVRKSTKSPRSFASQYGGRSYSTSIAAGGSNWLLGLAGASFLAGSLFYIYDDNSASAATNVHPDGPFSTAGKVQPQLPNYTKAEIAAHKTPETGIWVIYKNGVYDITQFVEEHPGGKARIMLAAGGSIEAFWALYQQHVSDEVAVILETHRIGNVAESDRSLSTQGAINPNDPYGNDPERHPALLARMMKPYNAETPPVLLAENLLTPNELFYVRNHLPVPDIDAKNYVLEIAIEGRDEPLRLTLDDLISKFPKHEVDVTLQCAGNRRTDLNKVKEVRGLAWDIGAIGTAKWGGAKLRDVLKAAGLDVEDETLMNKLQHVHFEGLDRDFEKSYTASVPMEKATAIHGDCLIAYEMNGAPIPRDHGYPVRAIVPGTVGARNVKWLHRVKAASTENEGHWQQNDYKGFSPNVDWANVNYKTAPAIQDLPIQSAITVPVPNTVLEEGSDEVLVKGYAWAGGGRGIVRVDVSADGGNSWHTADLERPEQPLTRSWAWTLFSATVPLPAPSTNPEDAQNSNRTKHEIVCKAVDSSYNSQPDTTAPIWNLRGVLSHSWHRVHVFVPKSDQSL